MHVRNHDLRGSILSNISAFFDPREICRLYLRRQCIIDTRDHPVMKKSASGRVLPATDPYPEMAMASQMLPCCKVIRANPQRPRGNQ